MQLANAIFIMSHQNSFIMFKSSHIYLTVFVLMLLASCGRESVDPHNQVEPVSQQAYAPSSLKERVVVANRGSGDISVIDAATNTVIQTVAMPDNGTPMYVVHVPSAKRVFVGDRANNRVVAFNEDDFSVEGIVPCGNGVFHMWAAPNGSQLWVNNDFDNTTTIINPNSLQVKGTAQTPQDLVTLGGKPHDVIFDPSTRFAYVSVLGISGANDYVVKYNTNQYQEVGRAAVGKDPHLSATDQNNFLYVPCQGGDVYVLDRTSLATETIIPFTGAHGAGMSNSGDYFYVTDLPGTQLGVISTTTNTVINSPVSTPFPIPHNIAINSTDTKVFVTHSGATADKLSIYTANPNPSLQTSLTLGTNPFGLVYYVYR